MGLGGNVHEWEEGSFDLSNSLFSDRAFRGGFWNSPNNALSSSSRFNSTPNSELLLIGFRVASLPSSAPVPEPTSMAIFGLGALAMAYRTRRKSKA
jgi:hypothetical protein